MPSVHSSTIFPRNVVILVLWKSREILPVQWKVRYNGTKVCSEEEGCGEVDGL